MSSAALSLQHQQHMDTGSSQQSPPLMRVSPRVVLSYDNSPNEQSRQAGQDQHYQSLLLSQVPKFDVTQQQEILSQHSQLQTIGGSAYPETLSEISSPSLQSQGGLSHYDHDHRQQTLHLPLRGAQVDPHHTRIVISEEHPPAAPGRDDMLETYRLSSMRLEHTNDDLTRRLAVLQVV